MATEDGSDTTDAQQDSPMLSVVCIPGEPLSALDPSTSRECLDTIVSYADANAQAVVCSLHQVELARAHLGRIIGLRQGRVHFDCPARDVDDGMIESLYRGYESEIRA